MSEITAKRVSNYELFYDLVFVLATSSLTGSYTGAYRTQGNSNFYHCKLDYHDLVD